MSVSKVSAPKKSSFVRKIRRNSKINALTIAEDIQEQLLKIVSLQRIKN